MKYKLLGLAVCAAVIALSIWAAGRDADTSHRYHQHLQAAVPAPCADHGDETFCTHLPLVIIDTAGQEIPGVPTGGRDAFGEDINTMAPDGRSVIDVRVSVIDNSGANNHPTDTPALETLSEMRVRGHSSRHFDKKPYLLNFVNEDGQNRNLSVMGMDAHHEWALHGPYLDKSLVRNYLWYNIVGEAAEYAPNVRFCEVLLNGEYQGLYLLVETIANGDNCRLNLAKPAKNATASGYLLRVDRTSSSEVGGPRDPYTFTERTLALLGDISIRYPGRQNLTPELRRMIERDVSDFERALYSYDYDTDDYGFWNWIDVDSFADYFLLNEFSGNSDAGLYSTYLYKDLGGKYKMVVWDFNNACNNYVDKIIGADDFSMLESVWFSMLVKDEYFVQRVLDRYEQLRGTYLNEDYLLQYIDDTLAYLGPAVERNFEKWGYTFAEDRMLHPDERNPDSHAEAVAQLKSFIVERGRWLDRNIGTLRQYCHESKVKAYNH